MRCSHVPQVLMVIALALLSGCSGGGGSDNGGGETSAGSAGRTSSTGVRLIHGGLDEPPVSLEIDGKEVSRRGFGEESSFSSVAPGARVVRVSREGVPLFERELTFEKDTEYSVLLFGEARLDTQQVQVISEPIARPAAGESTVTVVNLLGGRDGLRVRCFNQESDAVGVGTQSARITVPAGPQLCRVSDDNGALLGESPYLLADRGELSLITIGSRALGVSFVKAFRDLD